MCTAPINTTIYILPGKAAPVKLTAQELLVDNRLTS